MDLKTSPHSSPPHSEKPIEKPSGDDFHHTRNGINTYLSVILLTS